MLDVATNGRQPLSYIERVSATSPFSTAHGEGGCKRAGKGAQACCAPLVHPAMHPT